MQKMLQGLSILSTVIGAIMSLGSNFVTLFPNWILTDEQTQFLGLMFFMLGVVLFMFGTFIEGLLKEATRPRLTWEFVRTQYKPLHTQYISTDGLKITEKNIHSELDFAYLEISNNPRNRSNGQTAEKTTAQILFTLQDGGKKKIEYGRWCNSDMPLLQPPDDLKSLKQIDIEPGHPESLVVAFKKKHDNNIYSFYYTDHKRMATKNDINKLCEERMIGKPPANFQVILDGKFEPKTFDLILDIDQKGNFVINEKQRK